MSTVDDILAAVGVDGPETLMDRLRDEHAKDCTSVDCHQENWPCRLLPNGWRMHLHPMIYTTRLAISSPADESTGDTDGWCYDKRLTVEAMLAFLTWDGVGDPPGPWIKHVTTGRQGPGSPHYKGDAKGPLNDIEKAKFEVIVGDLAAKVTSVVAYLRPLTRGPRECSIVLVTAAMMVARAHPDLCEFDDVYELAEKLSHRLDIKVERT